MTRELTKTKQQEKLKVNMINALTVLRGLHIALINPSAGDVITSAAGSDRRHFREIEGDIFDRDSKTCTELVCRNNDGQFRLQVKALCIVMIQMNTKAGENGNAGRIIGY